LGRIKQWKRSINLPGDARAFRGIPIADAALRLGFGSSRRLAGGKSISFAMHQVRRSAAS
jgi:hypothetical protein